MKRYRSHKVVEAGEISAGRFDRNGSGMITLVDGRMIDVPPGFASRGMPSKGDFLVRYLPDGYLSWSPRDAFLDGYTEIEA